ncbi:serine protease [Aquabacterium sp. J223]|uniref:trypsin-like serine peptidase n=1 Tax=Aquabacterium sp. J223 TaxID=2898431 RepID=UPI0021ADEAD4|nr:trypsin-like peptidase domain-containing protein [Aquabacterium sp. J223]UUX94463.1 trypsin-like serine protease [Aquabacterium sp. J223]
MVETNNGGRVEAVPTFDTGRALAQGFGGGRLPERLRSEHFERASNLEFAMPQLVCGERDDRVPVPNPAALPWRCICHLVMQGMHSVDVFGTGFLVGPRTVVTAGHNLFSHQVGRGPRSVIVIPGRTGDQAPFGFYEAQAADVHPQWRAGASRDHDYGVVWLKEPIGQRVGWFGTAVYDDAALQRLVINNAGYPGDKRIGTQWFNAGRVLGTGARTLEYGLDTAEGQSGSPIFHLDARDQRIVVAIHAYGLCPKNFGIRITPEVFRQIGAWAGTVGD